VTATLRARLAEGPMEPREVAELAADLCAELARAHAAGRVHGRLSAESVRCVVGRWEVDFAAAGGEDERDDVRAIAAIVTEAFTGGTDVAAAMRLPRGVRAPILRSLHADRALRHGSVEELAGALGVALPPPPPARSRWRIAAATLVAFVASPAVTWQAPAAAMVSEPPAAPHAVERRTLVVQGGGALADMLATALAERPGLEVIRHGTGALRLEIGGDGVRLLDAAREATLLGERRSPGRSPIDEAEGLAARVAAALDAGPGPTLRALTTGSDEAYRAYVEGLAGDEAALRRAIALDPSFFAPRLRLAESAPEELPAAAALVGRAGRRGALALARVAARDPAARLAALEAERAFAPADAAVAAALAPAYRVAGKPAACASEAARAVAAGLGEAAADLAWCRAAAGDEAGAVDAAMAGGDPLLAGDVLAFHGRAGEARAAYARAGAAAAARLAWLAARLDARCPRAAVPVASLDDARAAFAVALACGDGAAADRIEAGLRRAGEPLADELAALRGKRPPLSWTGGDPLERGRFLGPRLAAARARGEAGAALAGFAPAPIDRHGLFEPPLLLEVALAQMAAGDAEAAALACEELAGPVGLYCRGRAAEAAGRHGDAFVAFRGLADRWTDADPRHRMAADGLRRMKAAVARARAARAE
jgi:hypothetical protein